MALAKARALTAWRAVAIAFGGAACSAALTNLAVPPLEFWPAALVSWFPLLLTSKSRSWRAVLAAAWLQGALTNAVGFRWIVAALHDHAGTSWPAALLLLLGFAALQGTRTMAIAALTRRLTEIGAPLLVAFPIAVGVVEQVFPMLVPYTSALALVGAPSLVQLAAVGGVPLVASWLAFVNAALFLGVEAARDGRVRAARYALLGAGAVMGGTAVVGRVTIASVQRTSEAADRVRIGVVQRATPVTDTGDSVDDLREATRALLDAERARVDLLLWPETALQLPAAYAGRARDVFFRDSVLRDSRAPSGAAQAIRVPLLAGALVPESDAKTLRNTALLVMPSGAVVAEYTKRELAPIGERTPFGDTFPGLRERFPSKLDLRPGRSPAGLAFLGHTLGVSICIEDISSDRILETVAHSHPDLLINLTSDAWFGTSDAAELHLALASFRAIEHRRELIRASHDGVTAKIAATGIVEARLPRNRPAEAVWDARWLSGTTIFERGGVEGWWIVTALVGIGSALGRQRRNERVGSA